jgi:fucose permease
MCGILIIVSLAVRYPTIQRPVEEPSDLRHTLRVARNPYALAFSLMVMLYVAVEVAIYVWMPTYLLGYHGSIAWLSTYALTAFFVLRAAGRFAGAWLIGRFSWTWILALFGAAIFLCFFGSLLFGPWLGVILLPFSGLFMSMIYPTLNSKGISCFHKAEHGAAAGVILFFTALAAALGPLAMAAVSDHFGNAKYGFVLATAFSFLLLIGLVLNLIFDPTKKRLQTLEILEYRQP